MKKMFCMIALAAITFGGVFAAVPMHNTKTMQTDTTKMKKKTKMKKGKMKMKMKDTTKMGS
jgi:hypothetical protein